MYILDLKLPTTTKTSPYANFLYVSDGGMKIKWVDDTHALGVFSTEEAGESFTVNARLCWRLKTGND